MNQDQENGAVHDKNVCAQSLLTQKPKCYGWLRRKGTLHQFGDKVEAKMKLGRAFSLSVHIPWQQRYAILAHGKLFIYNDETSLKAQKVLDLTNFTRIKRITDEEVTRDVPWPFELQPHDIAFQQKIAKIQCFSVTSEDELKKWEDALKQELSSGGKLTSTRQNKTPKASNSSDCGNDIYTNPDDVDSDASSSCEYVVPADDEKKTDNRRPLPAVPDDKQQQQQPNDRRALPPPPPAESKPNITTRTRSVPLPPDVDEPSSSPKRSSDDVSKPSPGRRPVPPPVCSAKPPVASKPSSTPTSIPGRRPIPPQPPPPLESPDEAAGSSGQDELVYEVGSVVDDAMWDGTSEEATQFMRGSHLREGNFLIRKATDGSGYSLLVICCGATCKFKIDENPQTKKMKISSFTFDNLEHLINHFREANLPKKTTPLTKPYKAIDNN